MQEKILNNIRESIEIKKSIMSLSTEIERVVNILIKAYKKGNKILIAGNGGSAADSQHFAAELVGRYKLNRKGLPFIALTTDSSILTAISNDYSFQEIFSRQIEALGKEGDIFFAISTSGNSENLILALEKAKEAGLITISLLGKGGGIMKKKSDVSLEIKSQNTPRIQEAHELIIHIICEILEKEIFENGFNQN